MAVDNSDLIKKAVIPVAGWGTRMLPITKSIEKCMLPVGMRPVIDYIVQDVVQAGITEIYFVVGEQSTQIKSFYGDNMRLNKYLKRAGKEDKLPLVAPLSGIDIHFVTQPSSGGYGTSVPVGICSEYIAENESAVVIMGDQFFLRNDGGSNTADLLSLVRNRGAAAGMYGVKMPIETIDSSIEVDDAGNFVRIIEKPNPGEAPTDLQNASFYIFDKKIFEYARTLPANPKRREFEITDPLNAYVAGGGKIAVGTVAGEYMDCGTPAGWLRANQRIMAR